MGSCLFWLDAHWCGLGSFGESDECPLLEELEEVNKFEGDHFILIDDARFFLSPPPPPHDPDKWPAIMDVFKVLQKVQDRLVLIDDDCMIVAPLSARSAVVHYFRKLKPRDNMETNSLFNGAARLAQNWHVSISRAIGKNTQTN